MAISTHILRVPNKMKDVILSHDAIGTKVLLRLGGVGLWHRYRITRTYTQIQLNHPHLPMAAFRAIMHRNVA